MIRLVVALVAVPILLVLFLSAAMELRGGELGSLTSETFELGPLPILVFAGLVQAAIFLPLLYVASKIVQVSYITAAIIGFLSALLPVLFGAWSVLTDSRLRWNFRLESLASFYPWLLIGALGGLLFWLFAIYRNSSLSMFTRRL
ncbi:hypothetical protein ABXN37_28595 [Piscinibacter sakaiensis]|uniref:hypothetical protein n=1 Tax=Piscinibacter sakaiensis TaxID=1547922 RepID=UPI0012F92EFB|nr:hypothetical protein [Piscinibacter sakaiensis]